MSKRHGRSTIGPPGHWKMRNTETVIEEGDELYEPSLGLEQRPACHREQDLRPGAFVE